MTHRSRTRPAGTQRMYRSPGVVVQVHKPIQPRSSHRAHSASVPAYHTPPSSTSTSRGSVYTRLSSSTPPRFP